MIVDHLVCVLPYSRKYLQSIKFGSLAVGEATVKFKSVKFKCDLLIYVLFYMCACVHIICTELPPNLNPPIFLFRPLGTKPPNLKITNISSYTISLLVDRESVNATGQMWRPARPMARYMW